MYPSQKHSHQKTKPTITQQQKASQPSTQQSLPKPPALCPTFKKFRIAPRVTGLADKFAEPRPSSKTQHKKNTQHEKKTMSQNLFLSFPSFSFQPLARRPSRWKEKANINYYTMVYILLKGETVGLQSSEAGCSWSALMRRPQRKTSARWWNGWISPWIKFW